jgi:hypothetical protein
MIDRHTAVTACYSIPGWAWPVELCALYDLCQDSRCHVEVGSYCGRSLYATCGALANHAVVTAVEPMMLGDCGQQPSPTWALSVLRSTLNAIGEVRPDLRLDHWQTDSLDAARRWDVRSWDGGGITSLYLDGSHHQAEVTADLEAWYPHVAMGGVIMIHDYWAVTPGVMEAVHQFFGTRGLDFDDIPQTRLAVHKKP